MLDTKWKLLQDQTASTSNAEPLLRAYIANLQRQLEFLNNDKHRLDMENGAMHTSVNDYKKRQESVSANDGREKTAPPVNFSLVFRRDFHR